MYKKHGMLILLTILLAIVLIGCGTDAEEDGDNESANNASSEEEGETNTESTVYNINVSASEESQIAVGIKKFKEELERLSDGKYSLKPHYNNGLGGEKESIEGMQINTIDLASTSVGTLGGFMPDFFVFDLPYLFDNREHAYSVLDGDIGQRLADDFAESNNVVILGYHENGFRNFSNSKHPINSLEDFEGIDHRTQESAVQVSLWGELGVNPTPMAWPEVYTALQQGVIDSQDNPFSIIYDSKFYEVQDYLTRTDHIYSPALIMISKTIFDGLSEEDQEIFREAVSIAVDHQRIEAKRMDEEMLEMLIDEGMELTEPDLEPFREAVQSVHDEFADEIGQELIDDIKNYDY